MKQQEKVTHNQEGDPHMTHVLKSAEKDLKIMNHKCAKGLRGNDG